MLALLGLGKIKLVVMVVAITAALTLIGGLYLQNRSLASDLLVSEANNGKLLVAIQVQKDSIKAARDNAQEWMEAHAALEQTVEELANVQRDSNKETQRLRHIFSRHDLTALSLAKPGLIERRIDAGSAKSLRVLERITAGDLLDGGGPGATAGETAGP